MMIVTIVTTLAAALVVAAALGLGAFVASLMFDAEDED